MELTIKELIKKKKDELKELKDIQASVKNTVYVFYDRLSAPITDENKDIYVEKAQKGFGRRMWAYQIWNPQHCPIIREYTASIIRDAIEEVTGDSEKGTDDLTIDEIFDVRAIVEERLENWLKKYWNS